MRISRTSDGRSSRGLAGRDTSLPCSGWGTVPPSRPNDETSMGTASAPPAAVVAGESAMAATAPMAWWTAAVLLAHGLRHSRRDRAGRRGWRAGHGLGRRLAQLGAGAN